MTVKELISQLEKFNGDMEVLIEQGFDSEEASNIQGAFKCCGNYADSDIACEYIVIGKPTYADYIKLEWK